MVRSDFQENPLSGSRDKARMYIVLQVWCTLLLRDRRLTSFVMNMRQVQNMNFHENIFKEAKLQPRWHISLQMKRPYILTDCS